MHSKRLLAAFLLILTVVFAACTAPTGPAQEGGQNGDAATEGQEGGGELSTDIEGEIVMWRFPLMDDQDQEEAAWNTITESFNEQYPNVTVDIESQPWTDRRQKLLSAIGSGRGPDVFYINPDMIPQFADNGAIVPISPHVSEEELSAYNPGTLIEWEGQLWALPILQNVPLFIWNTDLVESIGLDPENLPETIAEFEEWAVTARENDLYLSAWSANSATSGLTAFIWKFGGDIFDEEGNVVVDQPGTVDAFTFLANMYQNEWIPPDSLTVEREGRNVVFRQQQSLATRDDGNRFYGSQEEFVDDFGWAFGPILEEERKVTNGTVGSYAISTKAANPALVAEWIKHVTSPENSVLLNKTTGYLPPLQDAAQYYEDEGIRALLERTQYVQTDPVFPVASQAYIILAEEGQAAMLGEKTPEEAVQSAQTRIENAQARME